MPQDTLRVSVCSHSILALSRWPDSTFRLCPIQPRTSSGGLCTIEEGLNEDWLGMYWGSALVTGRNFEDSPQSRH